jgi:nicotinate-nucleotide--dimethylbenzimidazole phosphoribosyltransferase
METIANFAEITKLFAELPGPDLEAATATAEREGQLTKPAGSLGRLEELVSWLATWQGKHPPAIEHPRTAVFAGNHGVTERGVSAFPAEVTKQMVANFLHGGAAVNQLCGFADADLKVFELDLDNPTGDFSQGDAMTEADCTSAIAYGMMAVEPGIDLLCLGEMGIGNTTSAAAVCGLLFGGGAEDWVGPGTGVTGSALSNKKAVVDEAIALHQSAKGNGLEVLRRVGGMELAAIVGAILAARMARVPVVLDGFICTAAAATLEVACKGALDHCIVAHSSAEPGHENLMDQLGKKSLFDFGMRLGEASGASLAIPILKAAVACHSGMATFAEAGVSGKDA